MSIIRGALGLASLAVAAGAYRAVRETTDPAVAVGALVVTAAAGSAAAHLLAQEVGEIRRISSGKRMLLEDHSR